MKSVVRFLAVSIMTIFFSCEKKDKAIVLAPPGDYQVLLVDIGRGSSKTSVPDDQFANEVYVSLKKGTTVSVDRREWELEFDANKLGSNVFMNSGIAGMKIYRAQVQGDSEFLKLTTVPDSTLPGWRIDNPNGITESSAIGKWIFGTGLTYQVYIIDRGHRYNTNERYKKFILEKLKDNIYTIHFANMDNTNEVHYGIQKADGKSYVRFTFDGGGRVIDDQPVKNEWDFKFIRYWEDSVYARGVYQAYYLNGVLSNYSGAAKYPGIVQMAKVTDDKYQSITVEDARKITLSDERNVIGWDWKYFNGSQYTIVPNQYYIIKDLEGTYYKLRFISYYDKYGVEGFIQIEYKRL